MMAQLRVGTTELKKALKTLETATESLEGDIVLRHEDGGLVFRYRGAEVGVDTDGDWPGIARVPARFMMRIATTLAPDARIRLSVDDEGTTFHVGSASASCAWEAPGAVVTLPINATLLDTLRLGIRHSADVIRRSGLEQQVSDAQKEMAERIEKAAALLTPLGIGEEPVRELVDTRLRDGQPAPGPLTPDQGDLGIEIEGDQLTLG